jgi:hypothetical protein
MDQAWLERLSNFCEKQIKMVSNIDKSWVRSRISIFSSIVMSILLVFFVITIAMPVVLEDPSNITPDTEMYSDSQYIGVGDIEEGYEVTEPATADYVYQEKLEYTCSPDGEHISTGGSFNCDYRAVTLDGNISQGLVKFNRTILDELGVRTIVAEWTRLSPNNESTYVVHHHGYSTERTLNGTFQVYTPAEPGQYEFRLLLNTKLNPYGDRVNGSDVIMSSGTELFVYSEEQSASFVISEASYQLERLAVIGITIAWIQLILSLYKVGKA